MRNQAPLKNRSYKNKYAASSSIFFMPIYPYVCVYIFLDCWFCYLQCTLQTCATILCIHTLYSDYGVESLYLLEKTELEIVFFWFLYSGYLSPSHHPITSIIVTQSVFCILTSASASSNRQGFHQYIISQLASQASTDRGHSMPDPLDILLSDADSPECICHKTIHTFFLKLILV